MLAVSCTSHQGRTANRKNDTSGDISVCRDRGDTLLISKTACPFLLSIQILYKQNWLQFLFVVKTTAFKQQISKFYAHVLSTEASYHICTSQWPVVNVNANLCAYNL